MKVTELMSVETADISLINSLGWRQGSICPDEIAYKANLQALSADDISKGCCLAVISQDCDLVHPNIEQEPWCEVIILRPIEKADPNFLAAKSPRQLHLFSESGSIFSCSIHDRYRIHRELLITASPRQDLKIGQDVIYQMKTWVARRYTRTALPDQFNIRIGKFLPKIRKELAKAAEFLEAVFIQTQNKELASGEVYQVILIGVMQDDDYQDAGKLSDIDAALAKSAEFLNSCEDISADDYEVRSMSDISLAEVQQLLRWDYLDPVSLSTGTIVQSNLP